ncbi:UNVERIFIED_CONTAM: hypothetical protein RKD50_009561 [Streptomyces canus]
MKITIYGWSTNRDLHQALVDWSPLLGVFFPVPTITLTLP